MWKSSLTVTLVVILYLHVASSHSSRRDIFQYFSKNKNKTKDASLPEIEDNKDIDSDLLKRAKIPESKKHKSASKKENIGRPQFTPGSYSNLGDGIFMINDGSLDEKKTASSVGTFESALLDKGETVGKKKQDSYRADNQLLKINKLDKSNHDLAMNAVNSNSKFESYPDDEEYTQMQDLPAHQKMQDNNLAFEGRDDVEGMTNIDEVMLKKIENNLKIDDKLTGMNMAKEAEEAHQHEQNRKNLKGLNDYQKAILEGTNEIDLSTSTDKELYKRGQIHIKRDKILKKSNATESLNKTNKTIPEKEKDYLNKKQTKELHYEDLDEDFNVITEKRSANKKHKKSKSKRKSKKKNIKTMFKNSTSKPENNDVAGLIKVLNTTGVFHTKHHSKNINGKNDNSSLAGDAGKRHYENVSKNITNNATTSEKRKSKVELEDEVIDDRRYIASQALPDNLNGAYYQVAPSDEQAINEFITNQRKNMFKNIKSRAKEEIQAPSISDATTGSNQPEILEASPPSVQPQINTNKAAELKSNKEENSDSKITAADMADAMADFNSAEIKTAIADSDLNGLNQLKNAMDVQDAKNSVEYYNQPTQHPKNVSSEISLGDLSQAFKEAEKNLDAASKPKSESSSSTRGTTTKYVIHIPDGVDDSKDNAVTMETINEITKNAEQLFTSKVKDIATEFTNKDIEKESKYSTKKDIKGNQILEAARIIEKLIENDTVTRSNPTYKPTETTTTTARPRALDENLIERIISSKAFQKIFGKPTVASGDTRSKHGESDHPWQEIGSILEEPKSLEASPKADHNTAYKAFIKNIHNQALSSDKFQGSEGTMESFTNSVFHKLRINGGKVLGGSVRGGNIQGGVISGGDVTGGEIDGGSIEGGTLKGGTFMSGDLKNGIIEGGKIRGGEIMGGLIKSGLVDGGFVKGGIIEGGHLINGTIEGGDFKGGEIVGGKMIAGEIDGGLLKGGEVAGGTLKGGVIESGRLEGGTMFSGLLRGGVVKSGIIKGGIIDKGVVIQDNAEIGPGVEVHEGIIKGGRITVSHDLQDMAVVKERKRTDMPTASEQDKKKHRSSIFHIEVEDETPDKTITKDKVETAAKKSIQPVFQLNLVKKTGTSPIKRQYSHKQQKYHQKTVTGSKRQIAQQQQHSTMVSQPVVQQYTPTQSLPQYTQSTFQQAVQPTQQDKHIDQVYLQQFAQQFSQQVAKQQQQQPFQGGSPQEPRADIQPTQSVFQKFSSNSDEDLPRTVSPFHDKPLHWALTESHRGVVVGDTPSSPKLRASADGVKFRNGHAILDGESGYFDAGDYRGECFSDPEICSDGITIHLTLKIFNDSVNGAKKLYVLDSGASSKDSRGISVWVIGGMIKALVASKKETHCIAKDFQPYANQWVVLTLTWRNDQGASMYLNCNQFDESQNHQTHECETDCRPGSECHQMDVATRFMYGRPNKGPHFKVIHMAIGDITMFEKYHSNSEVKNMCGAEVSSQPPSQKQEQQQQPQQNQQQQQQPEVPEETIQGKPSEQQQPSEEQEENSQQQQQQEQQQQQSETTTTPTPTTNAFAQANTALSYIQPNNYAPLYNYAQQEHRQFTVENSPVFNIQPEENFLRQPQPVPMQGVSRSSHPLRPMSHTQYPSPPVSNYAKPEPTPVDLTSVKHNIVEVERVVYPTPPGLRKRKEMKVKMEPALPLVDYNTDRRSHLTHVLKGYTPWSNWSGCEGKCNHGIQSAVRYCRSKNGNCSKFGPAQKTRKCVPKGCKGAATKTTSKKSETKAKHSEITEPSLESQLNRLKR